MKIVQIEAGTGCLYALDSSGRIWRYDVSLGWVRIENPFPAEDKPDKVRGENEPPDFNQFYINYPRKDGRRAAAQAFSKALKRHPDYSGPDLTSAASLFAQRVRNAGTEPQFIPLPATWLNQDRFREYFDE